MESYDLSTLLLMKQETWWGTHGTSIINSKDQERWFENISDDCLVLVGETKKDDRDREEEDFLGVCIISDIDWIAHSANISGAVGKSRRSTEMSRKAFEAGLDFAFEMLNLRRLGAEVTEYNYPAQQIEIQHLGFTIEGIRRSSVFKAGKYYNSIMLGMFHCEWMQTSRVFNMNWNCNKNFDHDLAHRMSMRSRRTFGWNEPGV